MGRWFVSGLGGGDRAPSWAWRWRCLPNILISLFVRYIFIYFLCVQSGLGALDRCGKEGWIEALRRREEKSNSTSDIFPTLLFFSFPSLRSFIAEEERGGEDRQSWLYREREKKGREKSFIFLCPLLPPAISFLLISLLAPIEREFEEKELFSLFFCPLLGSLLFSISLPPSENWEKPSSLSLPLFSFFFPLSQ